MKGTIRHLGALALLSIPLLSCSSGYGEFRASERLSVLVKDQNIGSVTNKLPINIGAPIGFTVKIEAHKANGELDLAFNGTVRLSSKPGTIKSVTGPGAEGRSVQLKNGVADDLSVQVLAAYGDTYIWADDIGYVPADPGRTPKPQCSDGIDNDGDGAIDFPDDPGCAYANDDTEELGSFASGASQTIYFDLPRIADIRGIDSTGTSLTGGATAFPNEQVRINTGYDLASNSFKHNVVVTRIAADGFYATDIDDPRGYSSVFAFNFNSPANLRVCDRLTSFTGTASDFFGFTEINFPTWSAEYWDPTARKCLVPEPEILFPGILSNLTSMQKRSAAMVRVVTQKEVQVDVGGTKHEFDVHVGKHLGPAHPADNVTPTDDASNCDLNEDGKIDFYTGDESKCSSNCTADSECTEYSNYAAQSSFTLVVTDKTANIIGKIQGDASVSDLFNPIALRGQSLRSFTGTLRYFSGGQQFTIEARCGADVVIDLEQQPAPSDAACVFARTISENNSAQ